MEGASRDDLNENGGQVSCCQILCWWILDSSCSGGLELAELSRKQKVTPFLTGSIDKRSIFDHGNTTNRSSSLSAFQNATHRLHTSNAWEDDVEDKVN